MSSLPLIIGCAVTFTLYMGTYMRMPILPLFAQELGAGPTLVGFITSAFMLVAASLAVPFGFLSDRWGRKRVILLGIFCAGAASLLFFFAHNPYQLIAIAALGGVGISAFTPPMMSYVGDVARRGEVGRAYGWYTTALYLGMTLGPAAGGWVAGYRGFTSTFLSSTAVIVLAFLLATTLGKSSSTRTHASFASLFSAWGELKNNRLVLACWLATFTACFSWGIQMTFLPLYAKAQGITPYIIGLLFAGQALTNAVSRLPVGHWSDRVGQRRPFIFWGTVGAALSVGGLCFFGDWKVLLLLSCLNGLFMGISFIGIGAELAESVAPAYRGLAMGGYATFIYGGMMVGPALAGKTISLYGYTPGFIGTALLGLVGSLLFYLWSR
jgi:MFS family permease